MKRMLNIFNFPLQRMKSSHTKKTVKLLFYIDAHFSTNNGNLEKFRKGRCGIAVKSGPRLFANNYTTTAYYLSESREYIDYSILPNIKRKNEQKTDVRGKNKIMHSEKAVTKKQISRFLKQFNSNKAHMSKKMKSHGLDEKLFDEASKQFKVEIWSEHEVEDTMKFVLQNFDTSNEKLDDLFVCFYNFVKQRYPVTEIFEELKVITNLKSPENWFITARGMKRRIIFHAGPTNSGKTHHALRRFEESNTGIYGGPLRMLAAEVYERTNNNGIFCDMLTGEQRLWARSELEPSSHVACTVEMCKNAEFYDCAVIDEIQLLRDKDRGWGWTSAFLGIPAKEIHVCGEPAAENLIKSLIKSTGDEFEVREYKRLTPLHLLKKSIGSLKSVKPGDCVVAFSRQKIFRIKTEIEKRTRLKCSVIYGGLPPSVRLEQARKFNDPNDEHCILVASDAIGMGINLSIKRLIFDSLRKFDGQQMIDLPSYHAKQIAGRAGRFATEYSQGYVTTLHERDLLHLHELISSPSEDVEKAGIRPTFEQIELISHLLPKATLADLFENFVKFAKLDDSYFMCDIEHLKNIAKAIEHIPLTLRERYALCSATTDRTNRSSQVITSTIKIGHYFSEGKAIDENVMKNIIGWPPKKPRSLDDLERLESVHDIFDLYLWMSYRYEAIFIDREKIRTLQEHIESLIRTSVNRIVSKNVLSNWKKNCFNFMHLDKKR